MTVFIIRNSQILANCIQHIGGLHPDVASLCKDSFSTIEEARNNLCYFDGSKSIDEETK